MATTTGDVLVETLIDWGVDVVFGIPGDGNNGIMEALRKRQDKIRFVQTRHEESAAFAACGYAKYTGKLGVCLATSGPGGIHLLNGLYDAKMDKQPVLAITGMQFHDIQDTYGQQDVNLHRLFEDVSVYNVEVMGPAHVHNATSLACRSALGYRGVAHVTIPVDFQSMPMKEGTVSKRSNPNAVSDVQAHWAAVPDDAQLRKAASLLNAGKNVAILAGRGALGAGDELEEVAELLGAPIVKALLGKAVVPDDSPYTTGGLGLVGTKPSQEAIEECDTLFMVGTSFPYLEFLPEPGKVTGVQIDADPQRIGLRYPVEVGLVGDTKKTLTKLIPLLQGNENREFLYKAQKGMVEWWQTMRERATDMTTPMRPQVVAHEISKRLREDAIVACDSGTSATWWARHILVRRGQLHSLSGNLATMACGLPYAIGAQVAYPERQVLAYVGDGAFSMLMADFVTCVRYKLPVKVVINKNNTLGQIKWEQMVFLGNPEYGCDLQPIDFAAFARACGAAGYTVEDPKDVGRVLDEAFGTPGPVIVEAVVNPHEPPLPAKIKPKQAQHFAESLLRGQPNRTKIALTVAHDKVRELI